ncbi:MAG: hypothetical protein NTV36_01880, partial [Candidatus Staskawiczbacteria bacterium]|nr:hypothetical protein [Candidatus Staskawiczbacteria bacterium]
MMKLSTQTKILIAIVVGVVVLCGGGYVGIKYYKNYSNNKLARQESDSKLATTKDNQDAEIQTLKKEIEDIKKQQTQNQAGQGKAPSLYEQYQAT